MRTERRIVKLPKGIVPILEEIVADNSGIFVDTQDLCLFLIRKGLQSHPMTRVEKARLAARKR